MPSAEAVLALQPDFVRLAEFDQHNQSIGVVLYGACEKGSTAAIEVRAFAPSAGVNEDPVCGSGNGAVAAFIREAGQVQAFGASYVATQGAAVCRAGKLFVAFEGENGMGRRPVRYLHRRKDFRLTCGYHPPVAINTCPEM